MKRLIIGAGVIAVSAVIANSAIRDPKIPADKVILHAWGWSFPTIADNMKEIAASGYDYVQTSPANECFVGEDGGLAIFSQEGDSVKGKWYYHYQPTDWKIGNYQMGTRDQFQAMCDSARKYNVKVLVDVLPNHTAFDTTAVKPGLRNAVGGLQNLYHVNGLKEIKDYNDRTECTTGAVGGLPDVNTENPDFQRYFVQYMNDVINLGASGFRFDTAKHIGLPTDPLDPGSTRNNFWDVVSAREGVQGMTVLMPDSIFVYGEVLQDKNVPEKGYADYMAMCASAYGHNVREVLNKENANASDIKGWAHTCEPNKLVTWVESHDTYCNFNESAGITDQKIRLGWVLITARDGGMPLFYSRPDGSSPKKIWGNNIIGKRGNDNFKHPEVIAANKFRHAMAGQPEKIFTADKGAVIEVARGSKGAALINLSHKSVKLNIETTLPDGSYTDGVSGAKFKVKKGKITGKMAPLSSYLLQNI